MAQGETGRMRATAKRADGIDDRDFVYEYRTDAMSLNGNQYVIQGEDYW